MLRLVLAVLAFGCLALPPVAGALPDGPIGPYLEHQEDVLVLGTPAIGSLTDGYGMRWGRLHAGLDIADRNTGILRSLPMKDGDYDYKGLSEYLQFVKSKYPTVTEASVLLEQDIAYDVLVQTMDNVRLWQMDDAPLFTKVELFPDISVGDAPLTGAAAAGPATAPAGAKK